MERIKRPYTKRSEHWNKSDVTPETLVIKKLELHEYTYDDLPQNIKDKIETDLAYRRSLNLPDDSQERKDKALKYFIFQQKRASK